MSRAILSWVIFIAGIVLVWQLALVNGLVSRAALASPLEVFLSIPRVIGPSGNLPDVASTMWYSLLAFVISVPCGIGIGFVIFFGGRVSAPAHFLLDFLRSVPATALVPVFLILTGIGNSTKVVVGTFSSTLIICLATIAGLQGRNATRVGIARILGITGLRRLLLLDIPEAAPQLFLGLRAGISLALVLVVVSEMMIGANFGLGKVIADMRYTDDKGRMYAAIIVAGVVGYGYNLALAWLERWIIHWRNV
jgi:NitT/TauT family transport system permease protein